MLISARNVTEIFKTPGKLRGKTPRTARKKGAPEGRAVGVLIIFTILDSDGEIATYGHFSNKCIIVTKFYAWL